MTEQELRALVRDAIHLRAARYGGQASGHTAAHGAAPVAADLAGSFTMPLVQQHASHSMFVLPPGADTDGPCIIEPAVSCTHCGYCKSYGH